MKIKKSNSMTGDMIKMGVGTIVGVGLIGATASAVGALPAGTAKNLAGIVPGLQSTALLGHNLKFVNTSLKSNSKKGKFI